MAEQLLLNNSTNTNVINFEDNSSSGPFTIPKSVVPTNNTNVSVFSSPILQKMENETLQTTKTVEFDGIVEKVKVSNLTQKGSVTLSGDYPQNTLTIPKYDISSIISVNDSDVDINFVLALQEGETDANPKLYTSSKFYNTLVGIYNVNPIYVNYVVDAEHIVLVNLAPLKQKISELRADELNLDINLTTSGGDRKYVQVHRNLFEKSNYQTTSEGGLKAEPTYDYIELLKYISWVVRKPNPNYNERLLQTTNLGQYGAIEVTPPSPTQPSTNTTTTPPSTQYPPIGRKGVEDEEEVLFNGELYSWIESLQQWRLQER